MLSVKRSTFITARRRLCAPVSLKAEVGRVAVRARPQRRPVVTAAGDRRPPVDRRRLDPLDGRRDQRSRAPLARRRGVGFVPQGREIFPLLTVRENLMTGFAALRRDKRTIDDEIFSLFPVLGEMMGRRGGDLSGGQQQPGDRPRPGDAAEAVGARRADRGYPAVDHPRHRQRDPLSAPEGRDGDRRRQQYFEWARDLADDYAVMDRYAVVLAGERKDMVESEVRRRLSV